MGVQVKDSISKTQAATVAATGEGPTEDVVYLSISPFDKDLLYFRSVIAAGQNKISVVNVNDDDDDDDKKNESKELDLTFTLVDEESALKSVLLNFFTQEIRDRRKKKVSDLQRKAKMSKLKIGDGEFEFSNVNELKKRVATITRFVPDEKNPCVVLDTDSDDHKLLLALLKEHPSGEKKMQDLKHFEIDVSPQGENRCCYVRRNDGNREDFSVIKIFNVIEKK